MNEKLKEKMISIISKCRKPGPFRVLDILEFEGYSRKESRDLLQNLIEDGTIIIEWDRSMSVSGSV